MHSALTVAEWCIYELIQEKHVRQEEKLILKTKISPILQNWIKNLERFKEQTEDREAAGGFIFDVMFLLNHAHPGDYPEILEKLKTNIQELSEKRINELHNTESQE